MIKIITVSKFLSYNGSVEGDNDADHQNGHWNGDANDAAQRNGRPVENHGHVGHCGEEEANGSSRLHPIRVETSLKVLYEKTKEQNKRKRLSLKFLYRKSFVLYYLIHTGNAQVEVDRHEDLRRDHYDQANGDRLQGKLRPNLKHLCRHAQQRIGGHEAGNEGHGDGKDGQLPPAGEEVL